MWGFGKQKKDYENMSEEDLVRLSAGGDTEAFNRLLELHETMLYRYLLLSTHNEADAALRSFIADRNGTLCGIHTSRHSVDFRYYLRAYDQF